MILQISLASLRHRMVPVLLTLVSIVISVSLLLSVEHIRGQVKQSFTRTVSGTDLIVGGRTGQINLLLYSVFRVGSPTTGISWSSVASLNENPNVAWTIPLSLGDAHKGFRVIGTTNDYFHHYQYGNKQHLAFTHGSAFNSDSSAVLGAQVAQALGYHVGDDIVISHGLGEVSFRHHDEHPFNVTGILAPTGTPVDRAVHVTLHGLESVHKQPAQRSLRSLGSTQNEEASEEDTHRHESLSDEPPEKISALLLGLKNRVAALQIQHQVNSYDAEPLMAILPGMALAELWNLMGNVEKLLLGISVLILISSLVGLITLLLVTMRERKKEMAVLRAIGAGPLTLLALIQAEAMLISLAGCVISLLLVSGGLSLFSDFLNQSYGLFLDGNLLTYSSLIVIVSVLGATWLCSFIPALAAYRQALHSGLNQT